MNAASYKAYMSLVTALSEGLIPQLEGVVRDALEKNLVPLQARFMSVEDVLGKTEGYEFALGFLFQFFDSTCLDIDQGAAFRRMSKECSNPTCSTVQDADHVMRRCSRCRVAHYCSAACQKV